MRRVNVYVHIPFCTRKCPYCDFLSWHEAAPSSAPGAQRAYFAALKSEIMHYSALGYGLSLRGDPPAAIDGGVKSKIKTAFIGGGTPTKPDSGLLLGIVSLLKETFGFADGYELTVEANPETLSGYPLGGLFDAGVTRLSAGVQSTHTHHLGSLGRGVDWRAVKAGLADVRREWKGRLSFDVLYGVPRQTLEEIYCDVERLMEFKPEHISAYQLTPEAGTKLKRDVERGRTHLPAEGEAVAMQEFLESRLAAHGLFRYEISNYARPGAECSHNVAVWSGEDYLGFGVSAMGFTGGIRYSNVRTLEEYLSLVGARRLPRAREESRDKESRIREKIAFGLRMTRGVEITDDELGEAGLIDDIAGLIESGLLEREGSRLKLARAKLRFHDFAAASVI